MNNAQKTALLVALAVFVVTLCGAPWDVAHIGYQSSLIGSAEHPLISHYQAYSPAWNSPRTSIGSQATLQVGVLVVWWLGIAVIYAGLFFLLKSKLAVKIGTQPLQPASPPIQLPADSPLKAEPPKTGNVFSKHKVWWLVLVIICLVFSLALPSNVSDQQFLWAYVIGRIAGMLICAFLMTSLVWFVSLLARSRTTSAQFMRVFTVALCLVMASQFFITSYRSKVANDVPYVLAKQEALMNCEFFDASLQYVELPSCNYTIQGRIKNNGPKTVLGFKMQVLIYAPDKTLVDTETVRIPFFFVDPGEVKPFMGYISIVHAPKDFTWAYSITDCDVSEK